MYKFLLILLSVVGMATATSAQQKQDMNSRQSNHKILVAYFSATGTTARAAQKVAHATGGELYAITPAQPYTDADLNWNDKQSRSSVEMNVPTARPAIKSQKGKNRRLRCCFHRLSHLVGPCSRIVNTFIESHDLKGRTVIRSLRPAAAVLPTAWRSCSESLSRFELAGGQVAQPYRRADRPAVGGGVGILTARTNKGYPYGFRPVDGGSLSRGNGRSAGLFDCKACRRASGTPCGNGRLSEEPIARVGGRYDRRGCLYRVARPRDRWGIR